MSSSYAEKMLSNNKIGSVVSYLQLLKKSNIKLNGVSSLEQTLCIEKKKNLSALDTKVSKQDKQIDEIVSIIGKNELNIFLKREMSFKNSENMVAQLESINITTYNQLEKAITSSKFIKMCRSNKKVLSSKQIKSIMFFVLEKINKLKMLNKTTTKVSEEIDILDMDFLDMITTTVENKVTIEQLKNKRITLSNLIKLTSEQGLEDVDDLETEIKELDTKINDYYMSLSQADSLNENIEDLINYMNTVKDNTDEVDRVKSIIARYSSEMNCITDNFGQNFEEQKVNSGYGQFNNELENIITKYDKEFITEDNQQEKQNFVQEQSKMIKRNIVTTLKSLDNKFNTNSSDKLESLLIAFKKQLHKLVKPEIFKQIINTTTIKGSKNQMLFTTIVEVAKIFTTIFYIQNNKINTEELYNNIEQFNNTEINKGKIVLVKSMNKKGIYIQEYENQVYINLNEKVARVEKEDIEFLDVLLYKNVKVISGSNKGVIGTVYLEKANHVMITKDLYGKNSLKATPLVQTLKIKKTDIKLFEHQYKETVEQQMSIQYKDLYAFYKNQSNATYPMVKFNFFQNNTTGNYKHFNSLYDIALQIFNSMISGQKVEYNTLVEKKSAFKLNKTVLVGLKKTKQNKEFITMKKQMKSEELSIKKLARQLKNMGISKDVLKTEELENKSAAYNHYVKEEKKVRQKKFKITKAIVNNIVKEEASNVDDIMASLLL